MARLVSARHDGGFRIWLRFGDGLEGSIDLASELHGRVFEPLRDPAVFGQVQFNADIHTITWPNGADFAPEYLYELVRKVASPALQPTGSAEG